jgi:hypothetical protein
MKRVALVTGVLVLALIGALTVRAAVTEQLPPVTVVQWSNNHPMREGLLPEMAAEFNADDHKTASGHPIEVTVIECDSVQQRDDLVSRSKRAGPAKNGCRDDAGVAAPSPTIVTPQSADWLVDVNNEVESEVVDVEAALPIAKTWLGIVTRREMATCLGWPDVEFGYNDLFDLLRDGWSKYGSCVRTEWLPQALVAFTNPRELTLDTGVGRTRGPLGSLAVSRVPRHCAV